MLGRMEKVYVSSFFISSFSARAASRILVILVSVLCSVVKAQEPLPNAPMAQAQTSLRFSGPVDCIIPVAAQFGELCPDARDRGCHVPGDFASPGEQEHITPDWMKRAAFFRPEDSRTRIIYGNFSQINSDSRMGGALQTG